MKRQLDEIVESQKEKKIKRNEEISSFKKQIDEQFSEKKAEIQKRIQELKDQDLAIENEKKSLIDEFEKTLGEKVEYSFLSMLNKIDKNEGYFFPYDDEFIETLRVFMDDDEEAKEVLKAEGVLDSELLEMLSLLRSKIKMTTQKATFHLQGRVKGYKGDETTFKFSGFPTLEDSFIEPWKKADWAGYYDKEPHQDDIEWPDHKSTMAFAKTYQDVVVVELNLDENVEGANLEDEIK
jgi:hypothetical protein